MIVVLSALQFGVAFGLPQEGPLAPYRDCVVGELARAPVSELRYDRVSGRLETSCGRLRDAAMPQAIEAAVSRAAQSGYPLTSQEIETRLPILLQRDIRGAIHNELRARGVDPYPAGPMPSIPVPRPAAK